MTRNKLFAVAAGALLGASALFALDQSLASLVEHQAHRDADTTARHVLALAEKLDKDLVDKMKVSGIQVNEADKKAFVDASKGIYTEFSGQVKGGQALIDKALSLAKGS